MNFLLNLEVLHFVVFPKNFLHLVVQFNLHLYLELYSYKPDQKKKDIKRITETGISELQLAENKQS